MEPGDGKEEAAGTREAEGCVEEAEENVRGAKKVAKKR